MPLEVGGKINQYAITGKLGEGGMGTVFAAEDTKLGRQVAIKVLPAKLAGDPERLERFEREARTVASLNHPNVVTLYSVEEVDDIRFLTMELIDGEPLSEVIGEEGMRISEFFRIALPLVEAIASAHARGITHRDLKPPNIMVDRGGRVKVLDFGLAKLTEGHPLISSADAVSDVATNVLTGAGMIVGTVAYMAPEQAEGKPVDARSDVFALGVLFYEMITGQLPFTGDSPVSVLSAILRTDPAPVMAVRSGRPRQLQRILDRCLAKDPNRRYQTVLDLRNALDALRDELRVDELRSDELQLDAWSSGDTLGAPGQASALSGRTGTALRVAALVAVGAMLGAAAVDFAGFDGLGAVAGNETASPAGTTGSWALEPLVTNQDQTPAGPTFHPDGLSIVYAAAQNGQQDLWRIPVAGGEPEQLTTTPELSESAPVYSPDGEDIAYVVESGNEPGIYVRPSDGNGNLKIPNGTQPAWSPSGDKIAYTGQGAIFIAEGLDYAETQRMTSHLGGPLDPAWSPDEDALLVWSEPDLDVLRVPLDGSEPELLGLAATGEQVGSLSVSGSKLIFTKGQYGGHMSAYSVDLDATGRPLGTPEELTSPITDDRDASVSHDGATVAFLTRNIERHLYAVALDADGLPSGQPQRLTRSAPLNYYPALSRDGKSLAWTAHSGSGLLYRMDLSGLVFGEPFLAPEIKETAMWDRQVREITAEFWIDGQTLFFGSTEGGTYHLRKSPCSQCSGSELPVPPSGDDYYVSISPDGSLIAFTSTRNGSGEDVWIVGVDGTNAQHLTDLEGAEQYPVFSSDGRSVLFRSLQGEDSDIWEIDIAGTGEPRPVIDRPGEQAWAVPLVGGRIYFSSNEGGTYEIWMRDVDGSYAPLPGLGTLPSVGMFTKFAVADDKLIMPMETVTRSELWVLRRSR